MRRMFRRSESGIGGRSRRAAVAVYLITCVALSALGGVRPTAADEPDELRLARLAGREMPLHWENVEGAPEWVAGPAPTLDFGSGIHRVRLAAGETVTVRVPARSALRVVGVGQDLRAADLAFRVAEDPALAVDLAAQEVAALGSLVCAPRRDRTTWLEVRRPATATAGIGVALFLARRDAVSDVAPYRGSAALSGETVNVRHEAAVTGDRMAVLEPGVAARACVTGPARLELAFRVRYTPDDAISFSAVRIEWRVDGVARPASELETRAEFPRAVYVDGVATAVGRRETAYLDLPAGAHDLALTSSAPGFARLGVQAGDDLLITGLNGAFVGAGSAGGSGGGPAGATARPEVPASLWDWSPDALRRVVQGGDASSAVVWRAALRIGRENGRRDGGLLAAALAGRLAAAHPEDPRLAGPAEDLRAFHTFYRELLPRVKRTAAPDLVAWFAPRRPAEPGEARDEVVLSAPLLEDALDDLGFASFVATPSGEAEAHEYLLPPRAAPSTLRLAVEVGSLATPRALCVAFDERAPVRLEARPAARSGGAGSMPELLPGRAEAALAALTGRDPAGAGGTLGGAFARWHAVAPRVTAAVAELPLPPEVRRVRVWLAGGGASAGGVGGSDLPSPQPSPAAAGEGARGGADALSGAAGEGARGGADALSGAAAPVRVALAYRAARPFELGERDLLATTRAAGSANPVRDLWGDRAPAAGPAGALRDLANHGVPFARRLRAAAGDLEASVGPARTADNGTAPERAGARDQEGIEAQAALARRASAEGAAECALELWADVERQASGAARGEARIGKAVALLALGEEALGEQALRGMLLHDPDPAVRRDALAELVRRRTETEDTEFLVAAGAAAAFAAEGPGILGPLAEALRAAGEPENALLAALLAPPAERPAETVLTVAWRARAWQAYAAEVGRLPDAEQRAYWSAWRRLAAGDEAAALGLFNEAGKTGAACATALARGQAVRAELGSGDAERRARAVFAWEDWQETQPGGRTWREEPGLIVDHAGVATLHSGERDLYLRRLRATAERPARLRVLGPVRLRLALRPAHPAGATAPLAGYAVIRETGMLRPVAIANNLPAAGLAWLEEPGRAPGRQVTAVLALGRGLHELTVEPGALGELLVGASVERPELPLGILPPLTPATLAAALGGGDAEPERAGEQRGRDAVRLRVLPADSAGDAREWLGWIPDVRINPDPRTLPDVGADPRVRPGVAGPDRSVTVATAGRLALRTGGVLPAGLAPASLPEEERLLVLARRRLGPEGTPQRRSTATAVAPEPEIVLPAAPSAALIETAEAWYLGTEQYEEAIDLPAPEDAASVRRRMSLLAYVAEARPTLRALCVLLGERLHADHRLVPGLQGPYARLVRDAGWEPVTDSVTSAGVRSLPVIGWSPESPALRARRALLPPLAPADLIVTGDERLGVTFPGAAARELDVELAALEIEYALPMPLTVALQVGDAPETTALLPAGAPALNRSIALPAGEQTVRFRIDRPVANQFLRVRVRGAEGAPLPAPTPAERTWQIATPGEPLTLRVLGPAWLRIDEVGNAGRAMPRYREVRRGWQTVELRPSPPPGGVGGPAALFRVFRWVPGAAGAAPPASPRWVARAAVTPPPPYATIPGAEEPPALRCGRDRFGLGGQEDGTWSIATRGVRRRLLADNDVGDAAAPDRFVEVVATRRALAEEADLYTAGELLGRVHEERAPTVGARGKLRYSPDWLPGVLQVEAAGYLQSPGGVRDGQDRGVEWSLAGRATLSQRYELGAGWAHTPAVALFGRALSLHQNGSYAAGELDEDVFTSYKAQHRNGAELAESLTWRPLLDLELGAGAALVSNEGLFLDVPDRVELTAFWRQLWGPVETEFGWVGSRSFADRDRVAALDRYAVTAGADWEIPLGPTQRLEFGIRYRHDFDPRDDSGFLLLTWHFDHGRGYRDFRPGEVGFRDVREGRRLGADADGAER